jgi:hypothetical protein
MVFPGDIRLNATVDTGSSYFGVAGAADLTEGALVGILDTLHPF